MGEVRGGSAPLRSLSTLGVPPPRHPLTHSACLDLKVALQAPREKKELPLGTAASLGEGAERGEAGISPGSHLAPVPSVGLPGPGQGSLGRPPPSPSPTDAHQHGPQLHAARELQAAAKAQRLLQVLLTGLGDPCRDRGQRGRGRPGRRAPLAPAPSPLWGVLLSLQRPQRPFRGQ